MSSAFSESIPSAAFARVADGWGACFRLALSLIVLGGPGFSASAAASDGSNASAQQTEQAASPQEQEPIQIDARPSRVNVNGTIIFTQDGIASYARESMAIVLLASPPQSLHTIGFQILEEPIAVTDKGERLRITGYSPKEMNSRVNSDETQGDNFQVSITATPPTIAAETLERVTARLRLNLGQWEEEQLEFGPLAELVGKTVEIPGTEECTFDVNATDHATASSSRGTNGNASSSCSTA